MKTNSLAKSLTTETVIWQRSGRGETRKRRRSEMRKKGGWQVCQFQCQDRESWSRLYERFFLFKGQGLGVLEVDIFQSMLKENRLSSKTLSTIVQTPSSTACLSAVGINKLFTILNGSLCDFIEDISQLNEGWQTRCNGTAAQPHNSPRVHQNERRLSLLCFGQVRHQDLDKLEINQNRVEVQSRLPLALPRILTHQPDSGQGVHQKGCLTRPNMYQRPRQLGSAQIFQRGNLDIERHRSLPIAATASADCSAGGAGPLAGRHSKALRVVAEELKGDRIQIKSSQDRQVLLVRLPQNQGVRRQDQTDRGEAAEADCDRASGLDFGECVHAEHPAVPAGG